jgi:hypothetical protein
MDRGLRCYQPAESGEGSGLQATGFRSETRPSPKPEAARIGPTAKRSLESVSCSVRICTLIGTFPRWRLPMIARVS